MYLDVYRNLLTFQSYAKLRFEFAEDLLVLTHSPVPPPQEIRANDWLRPRLYDLWSFFTDFAARISGSKKADAETLTTAIMEVLETAVRSSGAVPLLVYYPSVFEIWAEGKKTQDEMFFEEYCFDHPESNCFSLSPMLIGSGLSDESSADSVHWNVEEHRLAAEELVRILSSANSLK